MAAGMDFSPPFTVLEGGYSKVNASSMEHPNSENLDNVKQTANAKPPRNLSVMRHSMNAMRMLDAADLVSFILFCPLFSSFSFGVNNQ